MEAFISEGDHSADLTFAVRENPVIRAIRITGNEIFTDAELLGKLETKPGAIFNWSKGEGDYNRLLDLYYSEGYSLAILVYILIAC